MCCAIQTRSFIFQKKKLALLFLVFFLFPLFFFIKTPPIHAKSSLPIANIWHFLLNLFFFISFWILTFCILSSFWNSMLQFWPLLSSCLSGMLSSEGCYSALCSFILLITLYGFGPRYFSVAHYAKLNFPEPLEWSVVQENLTCLKTWHLAFWDFLYLFSFPSSIWTFSFPPASCHCPAQFWLHCQHFLLRRVPWPGRELWLSGSGVNLAQTASALFRTHQEPLHSAGTELGKTPPSFSCCAQISLQSFPVHSC